MAKLIAKSPGAGLLPVRVGSLSLTEEAHDAITCVAPFQGQEKPVSAALKDAIGAALPGVGRVTGKAGARVAWLGLGQVLVLGPPVAPPGAAVTDQSDGWACLTLEGPGSRAVLARLTPLDLRENLFKRGHAARSLLGHMTCLFLRTGVERYEMLVFRSMAATAVHELTHAMQSVAAQRSGA
ncbi:Sarcosine oxidase gamma subunit [Candidatus Rhodobacter oscarellae]|uniref:Sarcosine oxidase gamma subunit n=1 Tax=Candidatus Rhodobacter oscarellae TaxID=1675527 RepID=A0A0J9GWS5_9RHOB|nr:sarcosine oxidase subunit gamma family protein [Candidatus Rhodobacter lobularis]KMW57988.1 Sarcosine oxidase gamma subunit [Candidatus Rhodobacter lobularis]